MLACGPPPQFILGGLFGWIVAGGLTLIGLICYVMKWTDAGRSCGILTLACAGVSFLCGASMGCWESGTGWAYWGLVTLPPVFMGSLLIGMGRPLKPEEYDP